MMNETIDRLYEPAPSIGLCECGHDMIEHENYDCGVGWLKDEEGQVINTGCGCDLAADVAEAMSSAPVVDLAEKISEYDVA